MNTYRNYFLATCFWAFGLNVSAQDTITFEWQGSPYGKRFELHATNGELFTVSWGDSVDSTYIGQGNSDIIATHKYTDFDTYTVNIVTNTANGHFTYLGCQSSQLRALDVSKSTELTYLYCNDNQLNSLDVSKNTLLTNLICSQNPLENLDVSNNIVLSYLLCPENQLSNLDVSKNIALTNLQCCDNSLIKLDLSNNTTLALLWCYNNHLSLTDLYAASLKLSTNKRLGPQTLLPQTATIGESVDFSTQAKFGTPDTLTVFTVEKDGIPADTITDYIIADGLITFYNTGNYTVRMTNYAIVSASSFSAIVSVDITVRELNRDASLSNLTISEGILTPAFSPTVYLYTADVDNGASSITITATPTDSNAKITGDVGIQPLSVGANPFTITVTAEDGTTTMSYYVVAIRSTIGIAGTWRAPSLQIYPNPTSGKLSVFSCQFSEMGGAVEIYDVVGQCVGAYRIRPTEDEIVIDISHLAAGLYFLKIDNKIIKIVKQ